MKNKTDKPSVRFLEFTEEPSSITEQPFAQLLRISYNLPHLQKLQSFSTGNVYRTLFRITQLCLTPQCPYDQKLTNTIEKDQYTEGWPTKNRE